MASRLYSVPSLKRSLLIGGFGFGLASLCVFATVAFAERWMYHHLSLAGAYAAWTLLFIGLGGGALSLLVARPMRVLTFYAIFSLAFFLYAIGWTGAYFMLRSATGEWVGSLAGSVLMSLGIAAGFRVMRLVLRLSLVLFVANSVGYFLGAALNDAVHGKAGMLLWGASYGLALGAGLGLTLYLAQRDSGAIPTESPNK